MTSPTNVPGLKGAIIVRDQGVKVYGNKAFFASLANWASWLAGSPGAEKFSFELLWHLGGAGFDQNVSLVDARIFDAESEDSQDIRDCNFEVSFMVLEDDELEGYLLKKE